MATEKSADATAAVDVRLEDQERISQFQSNHNRIQELTARREGAAKQLQSHEDALEELEAGFFDDEGSIRVNMGEAYINVDEDSAQEHVAAGKARLEGEIVSCDKQLAEIRAQQAVLRKELIGRFGADRINLGDDE